MTRLVHEAFKAISVIPAATVIFTPSTSLKFQKPALFSPPWLRVILRRFPHRNYCHPSVTPHLDRASCGAVRPTAANQLMPASPTQQLCPIKHPDFYTCCNCSSNRRSPLPTVPLAPLFVLTRLLASSDVIKFSMSELFAVLCSERQRNRPAIAAYRIRTIIKV